MNSYSNFNSLLQKLNEQLDVPIFGKTKSNDLVTLLPQNEPDYLFILNFLSYNKIPFFTLTPKNCRPRKFIIKDLPADTPLIKHEINNLGFKCTQVYNFKSKMSPAHFCNCHN